MFEAGRFEGARLANAIKFKYMTSEANYFHSSWLSLIKPIVMPLWISAKSLSLMTDKQTKRSVYSSVHVSDTNCT